MSFRECSRSLFRMFTCGGETTEQRGLTALPSDLGPDTRAPNMPWPIPQSEKDHEGERKGVLCDLQSEAVSGPDASPHPLHVAEEHDDTEEGEVAGDTYEGAGHGKVVHQVPAAGSRDRKVAVMAQEQPARETAVLNSGCSSTLPRVLSKSDGQMGTSQILVPLAWGAGSRHQCFLKFPRKQTHTSKPKQTQRQTGGYPRGRGLEGGRNGYRGSTVG